MMDMTGRHRIKNFNIDDPGDRKECEEVLSKYSRLLGRILKCEGSFSAEGRYNMFVHWIEDVTEKEYRD
jgi:hypothetical protein